MKYKYVIIGAGPTGLGAAYRLKELGITDFIIVDKAPQVGGLATSYTDDKGFTWDIGGHVQFSHYKYFDDLMEKALGEDGWLHHQRESWVWIKNRFVPYPFQNNIRYLPDEDMWKCLAGIIDVYKQQNNQTPANFHEWILATFGKGLADIFMVPYNFKVWAYPPAELAYHWIGERVAVTDLKRVTENILFKRDDISWGPNNTFQFPKNGGTGAIWQSIADMVGREKIILNDGVAKISAGQKRLWLEGGDTIDYEHLLSSMPVDALANITEGIPKEIKDDTAGLVYSTSNIVGVGLRGKPKEELETKCWMYFPEDNCPFYRVTVFSNYSPNNSPDISKYWSLMAETSESSAKPVDRANVVEDTIKGMLNTKLISSRDDVVSTWLYTAGHGYPTPSIGRNHFLQKVLPGLEQYSIYSRGRFGAWLYEVSNQDHSMMQGVEWVNRMELGIPEVTLNFPNTANANWGRKV